MNLSDPSADEDSSSDEISVPAKRPRSDTYGASSTTSHGSGIQESEDEPPDAHNIDKFATESHRQSKVRLNYTDQSPEGNIRLSRSSLSENCSSPNDEDYQPSFEENDVDNEGSLRPSFHDSNDNTFYNKHSKGSNDSISEAYSEKAKQTLISMSFKPVLNENDDGISAGYSEKSKRMMSNMGFKPGKGLGKYETGRTEPVEVSTQKGRRGLGLRPSTLGQIPTDFKWSPDDSKPEAKEEVAWIPTPPEDPLSSDILEEWLRRGPKKLTIDDETEFVEPHVLKGVLESKTIFDTLDDEDLRHARFRSNPYETIGAVIFLNRAAVKMANVDAVFDFMFTKPKKQDGSSAIDKKDILYFADVCAGPGGFSEYILYRKGWKAKGFGFTLKGPCDFKLSDFYAGTPETFNPYYGENENGDIFDPKNLRSLKNNVLKHTDDKGVHFLMADGGFSVEGQENIQEILSKQLYLCQCLAALMLVRTGGHFIVKLFDVFTLFSVGLIYIMYRCFDKVSIHKPVTSRPANSERYLICMWKKLGTEAAERHLFDVNVKLGKGLKDGEDITELVPLSVIHEDQGFYDYIYKSNCVLGVRQIQNLLKIAAFSKDKSLKESTQAEIREACLKLWQLPDKVRTQPERLSADDNLLNILSLMDKPPPDSSSVHSFKTNILHAQPQYLERTSDLGTFKSVYDWHFMFLSSGKNSQDLKFFISCGGKQLYQLDGSRWKNVVDLHITMPAKTLIYGEDLTRETEQFVKCHRTMLQRTGYIILTSSEIVKEYRGEGNTQMYSKALHVIDALVLGGNDISHLPLTERINQCALFCTALEKPFDSQAIPIRCKRLFNLELFPSAMNNLEYRNMKRIKRAVTLNTPNKNRDGMFYAVESMLFIKEIKEPWVAQISKSSGCKYYFCVENKKPRSEYYIPEEARLDMVSAFMGRVTWLWGDAASAIFEGKNKGLSRADVEDYILHNVKR